ncbi:MAG: hypothetical protein WDM89_01460 [Rhizomicrobium sp.]
MHQDDGDAGPATLKIPLALHLTDVQMQICHQDAGRFGKAVL